jgi:hypothetical protein
MFIKSDGNNVEVFISEGIKLEKVRSIRYDANWEDGPTLQVEVLAMDDQTFEVANNGCNIRIEPYCLEGVPSALLSQELKNRGYSINIPQI